MRPITSNPIPEPIVKRGLAVEVKDLVRLLDTRELHPADQDVEPTTWARVSYRTRSPRWPPLRQRLARICCI